MGVGADLSDVEGNSSRVWAVSRDQTIVLKQFT